jgi:ABC-2 type transport system permease protein
MNRVLQQLKIEFKLYLRQPLYLLFSLAMPLFSFLFFGSLYSGEDYGGNDFFSMYIPGFCMLILFSTSVFNLGNQIVTDKEKGTYKRIMATPIPLWRFIGVIICKAFTMSVIGFGLMLLVAHFVFSVDLAGKGIFYLAYFAMVIFGLSIGIGVSFICNKINTYTMVMMSAFFPLFFLSDAAMPIMFFPQFMQDLAWFNPLYHINRILRYFWSVDMATQYASTIWLSFAITGGMFIAIYIVVSLVWRKRKNLF